MVVSECVSGKRRVSDSLRRDMSEAQLLEQRQARILQAVALEKPDRTPVILEYAGFAASVTNTPLPKGKCILSTDGETDLFKAGEILNGHMCLMGDVPAAMLTFGTPDEVYEYSRRLIQGLGPEGFILHSGCDIPTDAKLPNVQAMVAAATDK